MRLQARWQQPPFVQAAAAFPWTFVLLRSSIVNPEKVVFGFFILLALTLNVGFVFGDIDNPDHHHVWEFAVVFLVNAVATILKLGDRTQMGAVLLATSLVAMLQLIAAAVVWTVAVHGMQIGLTPGALASIVSLAAGAVVANVVSVVLLIIETVMLRR
jgi:hypothetical protein